MHKKDAINKYLQQGKVMQLATSVNNQPWVCTVYYVVDEELNLYWLSFPTRRHSQDIHTNNNVAITVVIKTDLPVIGVQAEGKATVVNDQETVSKVMKLYVDKYSEGEKFYDNFVAGKNKHQMYKFKPENIQLFDELNFAEKFSN